MNPTATSWAVLAAGTVKLELACPRDRTEMSIVLEAAEARKMAAELIVAAQWAEAPERSPP
jgi:hypothetical protein